ncbi:MAG: hypothetical protein IJC63_09250 [Myxococcaceae bacterium]|nr:hypothetical protein [Myxococcaceae bacterium]
MSDMGMRMDLQQIHAEHFVNAGFPEFCEMPEFYSQPKAVDREWLESTLFSPEIRRLMERSLEQQKYKE